MLRAQLRLLPALVLPALVLPALALGAGRRLTSSGLGGPRWPVAGSGRPDGGLQRRQPPEECAPPARKGTKAGRGAPVSY